MDQTLKELLKKAQLGENESVLYSILLTKGPATASSLAQTCTLGRSNVYYVLDKLISEQLVEKFKRGAKTFFRVRHPLQLKEKLHREQNDIEQAKRGLDILLPQLITEYNLANEQPGVFQFEGVSGVIRVYEELLADRLPIDSIQDYNQIEQLLPEYLKVFAKRRIQLGLPIRSIQPELNPPNKNEQLPKQLQVIHWLNAKTFPLSMDLNVTKKKVVLTTFKKESPIGIVIVDPEITKNFQMIFECLWQLTDRP